MIEIYLDLDDIELILTKLLDEKQKLANFVEKQPWKAELNKKLINIENLIKQILYCVKISGQKNEKVSQVKIKL